MEPSKFSFQNVTDQVMAFATLYGFKILLAIVILIVGLWLVNQLVKMLSTVMNKRQVDRDVQPFLLSLVGAILKVLVLLSVASTLGVETTSFVAIIGAAGLAVGLALQGSLANFAGGVLILTFKPFRVGDLISAQGFTGNVEAIHIFNTILVTLDNRTIILPNGSLSTSPITNISGKGTIRVDMVFAAGNTNDVDEVKASIRHVVDACPYALKNRDHDVLVTKLTELAFHFDVRVWTNSATYWETYYFVHEGIARQFAKDGVKGPEPTVTVMGDFSSVGRVN
ncbi:mechanosensitive ion channel family protein [Larkinella rosea]|uniref:Mechanosensitive ion channel family protein n=1 Tax=Larkinella rosea TaxID=2025312 RepID=A0A3P1C292_9BACT|nr:mechanosensitive ion channel domain-containing protein [Larkinella rosea]RRB07388.1 mechanosensitive ion channel family protein [Larkinella rosea]